MTVFRHVYRLRRRLEGKTDYKKRKSLLLNRGVFVSPRVTGKHIIVQYSKPTNKGDNILSSTNSNQLNKIGWKGSGKSLPAAYLIGLLSGYKALKSNVSEAVLYTGIERYMHASRISAILKGIVDSGVSIPANEESFPDETRIQGQHISSYAKSLLDEDKKSYESRFSKLLSNGLRPEDYPKHFEEIRKKIISSYGDK